MRPAYQGETPPSTETYCPICGSLLNAWGRCIDWRQHDDPTESYRDEDSH